MKKAILFHGTGCSPKSYWFPYIRKELEKRGYSVWAPQLPDADQPDLKKWLTVALSGTYDNTTIVIGHSAGCPLILSVLEKLNVRIARAILVAGYARILKDKKPQQILQHSYNWGKIRNNADEFILINSDNDPWGCDDVEGRHVFDHLGGMQIIRHGDGYMGSDTFHQPYKKFPLLVKLIE